MNQHSPFIPLLEFGKRAYAKLKLPALFREENFSPFTHVDSPTANAAIMQAILKGEPAMIARFGFGELNATIRYAGMKYGRFHPLGYVFGNSQPGWYTNELIEGMPICNGFFPTTKENLDRFGELMLSDMLELNILGVWQKREPYFAKELEGVLKVKLSDLEPYFHEDPWSAALEGKTVLVIHPFDRTIQQQYKKRELLFENKKVLPPFELKTIRAVQTLVGQTAGFQSWFHALEHMQEQIERETFDVAIIGAGAYGFPLAAFVKRIGKISVHLGGASQLLFGIRGKRWVDEKDNYHIFFNEHWVKPLPEEKPANAELAEGGSYW